MTDFTALDMLLEGCLIYPGLNCRGSFGYRSTAALLSAQRPTAYAMKVGALLLWLVIWRECAHVCETTHAALSWGVAAHGRYNALARYSAQRDLKRLNRIMERSQRENCHEQPAA